MDKKFLLMVTHSTDDVIRASSSLTLANVLVAQGSDLLIFLLNEGVLLGKKGVAETLHSSPFSPVKDLLRNLKEAKVPIYL
jgi:predicted peroxiredoxin